MKRRIIHCECCAKSALEAQVAELERRIKELEARPTETHTHFHTYPPVYQQPYVPTIPEKIWIGDPPYGGSGFSLSNGTMPLTANVTSVRFDAH